ncbi:hypothetical protein [Streptomyces sp. OE57]|uniref:hypothetical protein n=1 Tax=Streptomyces lacaronensis TaxID=3379885 RepID=UPI0039B785E6
MTPGDGEQLLSYPIPSDTALGPPAEWARLRQRCPVAKVALPSGDEASLLTRYDDVKQVLSDPRFTRLLNADDAARVSDSESGRQALARTELQATLDVLLRRLPTLELAVSVVELRRLEGLAVGGLRDLPVRW